ncbi:MAG: DUF2125 domain-containing protein [Acetobacteraceae bacterium]
MRRHRLVLTLILVPLVAIGGWSLIWLLTARQVQAMFQGWVSARRADGWQISEGREQLSGWPFSATVGIDRFAISGGGDLLPGGLSWRSRRLVLRLPLGSPQHLLVLPVGTQHVGLFGGPEFVLTARHLVASVPIKLLPFTTGPAAPHPLVANAEGVELGRGERDRALVTVKRLSIEAAPGASSGSSVRPAASLTMQADGITIPHRKVTALGPEIGVLTFSGVLIGRVPAGTNWALRLGAWRDHGGMVAVRSLSLVWGPLAVGATGRLMLDQKLQPAGEGTARVVGYAATLDALAGAGRIGSGVATAAKALLTLLARPSSTGGPPEVDVPLSLENRILGIGRIPLLKLPPLTWPTGP